MLCFALLNRFHPSNIPAAYVGAHNDFAADPGKRLLPATPPQPPATAVTAIPGVGYHQSSSPPSAVSRWQEFGKPGAAAAAAAAASLVDCSMASYYNNNLLL